MPKQYLKTQPMIKQIILLVILSFTTAGYACSCKEFNGIEEHISHSEIIFRGTVTSVIDCELETDIEWRTDSVKMYTFKVSNCYKGVDVEVLEITTGNPFGGCGDAFAIGQEYIIFANSPNYRAKNEGMYSTSICMGNGPVSEYSDLITILNKMKTKEILNK